MSSNSQTGLPDADRAHVRQRLHDMDRRSVLGKAVSSLAHALGTPLNVISGRASLIDDETSAEELAEHIESIAAQAKKMADMLRSSIDRPLIEPLRSASLESLPATAIVNQIRSVVDNIADNLGTSLNTGTIANVTLSVLGDVVVQSLVNVVVNAIESAGAHGTVTISCEVRRIDRSPDYHAEPGKYACFSVTDSGPGVDEEVRNKIYDMFFSTKGPNHVGIGLPLSQYLLRQQSGWIQLTEDQAGNTCFEVYVPLKSIL